VDRIKLISPGHLDSALDSKALDWLMLSTCEDYSPVSGNYISYCLVQAVLITVR